MRAYRFHCFTRVALLWCITITLNHHNISNGISLLAATTRIPSGNERDKLALLAIKAQITEDPSEVTSSWNESVHFCLWKGVSCGRSHQRVMQLNLNSRRITGYLSPSIGNLSFLQVLDLSKNNFQGEVVREIGQLFRLQELDLEDNLLGGQIPANLANCSNLRILKLSSNNFKGYVPSELGLLSKLVQLHIVESNLEGSIPSELGNISSLQVLNMSSNKLKGDVPISLGQLKNLTCLDIGGNLLSGMVPQSIYNLSYLNILSVVDNDFEGTLPPNIGLTLPNIKEFLLRGNKFSGTIPLSISNASNLFQFDISENNFFGGVPSIFGNLKKLTRLSMFSTNLGYGKANDLKFITSLTNCSSLKYLFLRDSNFGGVLPNSLGNLSTGIQALSVSLNQISGNIPSGIGNLVNLISLSMYKNQFTGTIPTTVGKLHKLQEVGFGKNKLSGKFPSFIGNLTLLNRLWLEENNFQGTIPLGLGNCKNLVLLHLYGNAFSGPIPRDIIYLSSLSTSLKLSRNHFSGSLPREVGKLINLGELDVSQNELSGNIPSDLGASRSLRRLYMDHNLFEGTIPESLLSLTYIEEIDLSHNKLSGQITEDFANLVFLSKLNLSFNDLEGELPTGGVFSNISAISVIGNNKLCGGIPELKLAKCFIEKEERKGSLSLRSKLIISIVCGLVGVCFLLVLIICWLRIGKNRTKDSTLMSLRDPLISISYWELLQATNGFSSDNLIATGCYSSVYKGTLEPNQTSIAVKVLKLENRGASKSFMAECEALRNIRHRNLVKIITACSSIDYQGYDFKALVYEFMPNGSLESWLYPISQTKNKKSKSLTLLQKLQILIDVASALDYLHNQTEIPIIHCDLKPSNILIDHNMTTRLGDFGLSRIIAEDNYQRSQNQTTSSVIKGTIGYTAPEYGIGSKVSCQGDVYSFGILLLETFIGKRPTDNDFEDGMNLNQFAKMALAEGTLLEEIVSNGVIKTEGDTKVALSNNWEVQTIRSQLYECLVSILRIGIKCSEESPKERMKISDALKELQAIKNNLLEGEIVEPKIFQVA